MFLSPACCSSFLFLFPSSFLPTHLILCLYLSQSLFRLHSYEVSSLKVALLIQILIMNGIGSGLHYGHLCVCVSMCILLLCVCAYLICERIWIRARKYQNGGRWWWWAALCLPPLCFPSERRDCPRLAWNSKTHIEKQMQIITRIQRVHQTRWKQTCILYKVQQGGDSSDCKKKCFMFLILTRYITSGFCCVCSLNC